jgi:hypothetical protein
MQHTSFSIEPLAPSWIQALIPLLKKSLEETAGRESTIEVVITFDASSPTIAKWNEIATRKVAVNLATRKVEKWTESLFETEEFDESLRRAIASISQEGGKVREELKHDPVGCRQLVLNLKEGRLTGIKSVRSIPIRNQKR